MNLSIQCACGASFAIQMPNSDRRSEALGLYEKWREEHPCPVRHELAGKLGYDLLAHQADKKAAA